MIELEVEVGSARSTALLVVNEYLPDIVKLGGFDGVAGRLRVTGARVVTREEIIQAARVADEPSGGRS
jgi:hypothetical protein